MGVAHGRRPFGRRWAAAPSRMWTPASCASGPAAPELCRVPPVTASAARIPRSQTPIWPSESTGRARSPGDLSLSLGPATGALGGLGAEVGVETGDAAAGVRRVLTIDLAQAVRDITVAEGRDPRDYVLIAGGGVRPPRTAVPSPTNSGSPRSSCPRPLRRCARWAQSSPMSSTRCGARSRPNSARRRTRPPSARLSTASKPI